MTGYPFEVIMKNILTAILVLGLFVGNSWSVENIPASNPASANGAASTANQDQLIEQLLTVSGMKKSLQQLQNQVNPSIKPGTTATGEAAEFQDEVAKLYSASYPKDIFLNSVKDAMKKHFDEKRYSHLLQLLSTPLSMRMADLESVDPTPEDFQNYVSQISSHPLSADRIKLIQRLDSATRSSAMLNTLTIASIESSAIAMSEDCIVNEAKIRKEIEKQLPEIQKATRSRAQITLAFTYRDISDVDLGEYVNTYEDKDSKWLQQYIQLAIEEQFKSGTRKVGFGMKEIVQSHKPKKTMFAPKCNDQEATEEKAPDSHPVSKARQPSGGQDLRDCLKLEDSAKVIECTEKAHKTHK
jgi:hypothetical protein